MKKTISLLLVFILLIAALPLTAGAAGTYAADTGAGETSPISAWWDGRDICWYRDTTVEKYYLTGYYRVEGVTSDTLKFSIRLNMTSADREIYDNINRSPVSNGYTIQDGIVKFDAFRSSSYCFGSGLARSKDVICFFTLTNDKGQRYDSPKVSTDDLYSGYKNIAGRITLTGVNDSENVSVGQWIYSAVNDCNVPEDDLTYWWQCSTDKEQWSYMPWKNQSTLDGVSRDFLGYYVRLEVSASGYDGKLYSEIFYYPYRTVTVENGTAYSYGQEGSKIKSQKGDYVFLTASEKDGYTFVKWEVLEGGVTIDDVYKAKDARFTLGDSNARVRANYTKAPSASYTVSGTVISYLEESNSVGLFLSKSSDTLPFLQYKSGNKADFSFSNIPAGSYTLTVTKKNHVTRSYDIDVTNASVTVLTEINLIGDANLDGEVTPLDVAVMNNHIKGKKALTDYALRCADVIGTDGTVTPLDISQINLHLKHKKFLWEHEG